MLTRRVVGREQHLLLQRVGVLLVAECDLAVHQIEAAEHFLLESVAETRIAVDEAYVGLIRLVRGGGGGSGSNVSCCVRRPCACFDVRAVAAAGAASAAATRWWRVQVKVRLSLVAAAAVLVVHVDVAFAVQVEGRVECGRIVAALCVARRQIAIYIVKVTHKQTNQRRRRDLPFSSSDSKVESEKVACLLLYWMG